jgi:hypothetical protein
MKIEKGAVIQIKERTTAVYRIFDMVGDQLKIVRVLKKQGYPLSGCNIYRINASSVLNVINTPIVILNDNDWMSSKQTKTATPHRTFDQVLPELKRLVVAMEPENLCCDGEVSHAEAQRKMTSIMSQWRGIENSVGRRITQDEVWSVITWI